MLIIIPESKHKKRVWHKIISPIDKGCWINNIITEKINNNIEINILISKNSLIKIIILEIIDKEILFLWSF